jgi:hypothetical protein
VQQELGKLFTTNIRLLWSQRRLKNLADFGEVGGILETKYKQK